MTNQQAQQENQDDIMARLALISAAVEANLTSRQNGASDEEATGQTQNELVMATCPIDPMERLLCESCQ